MSAPKQYSPGSVKTFSCPKCAGSITIRAVGISVTAICQSCGSIVDVANEELKIISKAQSNTQLDIPLPIGTRGVLFGTEWEVIGFTERGDYGYTWSEYLLFNPWQGFRFLAESDGHWTFVKMLRQQIDFPEFEGKKYKLFARTNAKVKYVMGEFYYRVKVGEKSKIEDYVAPPYILSREESDQDVIWSQGVYVRSEVVRKAFNATGYWPSPIGIAPNQPNPAGNNISGITWTTVAAFFFLLFSQMVVGARAHNQVLIDTTMTASAAQKETPIVTDAFDIPYRTGNLQILVSAPVSNNWLEVDAELVNQQTQEKDEAIETVEYYYGSDSDGPWSEGHTTNTDTLSAIEGGSYRLFLTADSGYFTGSQGSNWVQYMTSQDVNYRLKVTRDVVDWSNFWTALILLLTYPTLLIFYYSNFESRRWAESSPSSGAGDEES